VSGGHSEFEPSSKNQIKMSNTSCQGGPRYVDKEVGLREKEQTVESFVPDKLDRWEEGSAVEIRDSNGYAFGDFRDACIDVVSPSRWLVPQSAL
jgi:hypothetical protein